ncbi:MAG: hypothetical protein PWR21_2069 [Methanoculleus sp.]|nr:hypothetical protein [Methanoculleus sp.]
MKSLFALVVLVVALLLACGCTGTTSEEKGAVAAPTATPTEALPTSTQTPPPVTTKEITQKPTAQPTIYTPKYAAGEVLRNADATDIRLITKVSQNRYQMRTVIFVNEDLYIRSDKSFQEMGNWCEAREFDKMDFVSVGFVESIPVRDANGNIYGYLEYLDKSSMKFERPSPDKLTGDVKYVLEIWYNGDARVYASVGGVTTTKTYAVNGYSEVNLGVDDSAFVSVSKDDYGPGTLKAILKAEGVVVAEGETNDKYGHISLSFYT